MRILDVGCGRNKNKGAIGIDKILLNGVDILNDSEIGLPFKNNIFDIIICDNILEHINNFMFFMKEIWRVCKSGSLVKIKVPYFSSPSAFNDPTHVRFFAFKTFDYFTEKGEYSYYSDIKFEIIKKKITFQTGKKTKSLSLFDPIINLFPMFYQRFFAYIFPAGGMEVELKAIK